MVGEILENFRAAWYAIVKVTSLLSLNIRSEGTSLGERICREVQPRKSSLRMDLHPKTQGNGFLSYTNTLPTILQYIPRVFDSKDSRTDPDDSKFAPRRAILFRGV